MKKFLPAFILLIVALGLCVIGDAASVPPWWMIGQSATENAAASFTVPISTTGNISAATATVGGTLGVTGKTTTGTLESGAATFTGNIDGTAVAFMVNGNSTNTGSLIGVLGRRYVSLGSNMKYDLGYKKISNASQSAYLEIDGENPFPMFYRSDAGSSNAFQYGPYKVWHSGLNAFSGHGVNTYFNAGTSDGSDNAYFALGYPDVTRGSYIMTTGNEYSTVGGTLYIQGGNNASGSILLRTADTTRMTLTYAGDIRFGGFAGGGTTGASLDNDGDLIRTPSDLRLKEDIQVVSGGLDKVRAMRGVTFNWKDQQSFGSRRDYGMIAQEVEAVIPEVVSQNPDGMKSLDYQKLVPVLVEAIKDQQRIIESIESRINSLEGK